MSAIGSRVAHAAPAAIAIAALAIGACGVDDSASERPTVAATTGIVADLSERVAGEDAEVVQIIPDASSPHDFQLSAEDRRAIDDSVLLVHNGAGLEQGIPIEEVEPPDFALTDHAGELLPFSDEEEGGADPHVWMDPSRAARALPALAGAMAEADPENAAGYRRRAEEFVAELGALDREIAAILSPLPPVARKLVTSHDSLGYFADRYGLQVIATPFPASGPEAEASASVVREVTETVESSEVPTVFAQADDNPELLALIAERAGVEIEDELLVEAPADAGSYVEMLRRDAELIRDGLAR